MELAHAVKKTPVAGHSRASEESASRPPEVRPGSLDAPPLREPQPAAADLAPRNGKWWVDEGDTTVGGPSFLGLSNAEPRGNSYSYLFQEEEERSHKAAWVLLVLLLVLGGAVYAKWQPIRDFVLNTAISHSRPQQPAVQDNNTSTQGNTTPSTPPTTTVASSDPQSSPPGSTTDTNQDQGKAASAKEGLPEGDKESAGNDSKRDRKADQKDSAAKKQSAAASGEAPAEEEAPAAEEETAGPARRTRTAPASEGGELVSSGEKYLYGRGVPRSCDQAVSYFNAAAAKQNPQAFSHLGALYATGECVPMDRAVAYAWFRRAYAKEPSNHYFEQNLTMLWREMTTEERQRATGRQ